ncbi:protein DEHYDRATION-INDUCED 19 homolog 5-like [Vicia villosa]|uniref:protein DEHYDRATION-INDUCED 19 homolog 5-like n=1 Tax=Vicia villosa TaxID=3911 RepID=UPI00273B21A9|nr:protein DEHYDRATION-INDUCED 19 homolog 5-like [Vicia villosa]
MDLDIMASIHSVNHFSTLQSSHPPHSDDYPVIHYTDVYDDYQSDLRCPFCDFDIQLPLPCNDFQEDYCSALKYMVCPVCEQDLGNDAIAQFTHSTSRKWGWKSEKSSNWSGNSAMLSKKLPGRGNKQELVADPLLSPFICNVPVPNSNSSHPDEKSSLQNKDHVNFQNAKRCWTDGVEQDQQEQRLKAAFVQNLILSTIFEET